MVLVRCVDAVHYTACVANSEENQLHEAQGVTRSLLSLWGRGGGGLSRSPEGHTPALEVGRTNPLIFFLPAKRGPFDPIQIFFLFPTKRGPGGNFWFHEEKDWQIVRGGVALLPTRGCTQRKGSRKFASRKPRTWSCNLLRLGAFPFPWGLLPVCSNACTDQQRGPSVTLGLNGCASENKASRVTLCPSWFPWGVGG
jgi:hypothetical protein